MDSKQNEEQCLPGREKYWSELTDQEKLERMRTVIKQQESRLREQETLLRRLKTYFEAHEHSSSTGAPTIPVKTGQQYRELNIATPSTKNPDETYF